VPRLAILYLALLLLPLSACGGGDDDNAGAASQPTSPGGQTEAAAKIIDVMDNLFTPNQLIVAVGEEVHWDWRGSNPHSVVGTFAGEEIDSGQKSGENRFTLKFEEPGTFEYHCAVHASMVAKVTVR
jgi:plastocyanin